MSEVRSQRYEQWLKRRKRGIGGSEVATVMGMNKYQTLLELYLDKISINIDDIDNERMEAGRRLEPFLRKIFEADKGVELFIPPKWKSYHGEYSHELATPDGFILDEQQRIVGIVEFKTSSYVDEDDLPNSWFIQLAWYVTIMSTYKQIGKYKVHSDGLTHNYVGFLKLPRTFDHALFNALKLSPSQMTALISTSPFITRKLQGFTDEHAQMLRERVAEFWNKHVAKRIPPKPSTLADLELLYPAPAIAEELKKKEATSDIISKYNRLRTVNDAIKKLQTEQTELKKDICLYMEDAAVLEFAGKAIITYKYSNPAMKFDAKKFKADNPDMYNMYTQESAPQRRFLLKK